MTTHYSVKSERDASEFLHQFLSIVKEIGMPIAEHKTIGLTQFLPYLGLLLNFLDQVIEIPERKRPTCLELIDSLIQVHDKRKTVQVQDIQKIVGHLNFVCQAIPGGKAFLEGLYALTTPRNKACVRPGHHRCINQQTRDDMAMFKSFFNELAPEFNKTIPFLMHQGLMSDGLLFFADAAGSSVLGFGDMERH